MKPQSFQEKKDKLHNLVEKMEPVELDNLEIYAEFLLRRKNESQIIEALRSAEYEDEDLDKSELEGVKKSKEQIKNGEFRDFDDYMKERGL